MTWTLEDFVRESNRIEAILRDPTEAEIKAHMKFTELGKVTVPDLEALVAVIQPGAVLRREPHLNVRVGDHIAPRGGPEIEHALDRLLSAAAAGLSPYETHLRYETLHPFTDGNGRSGRALWLWQHDGRVPIGFLHQFYYQTLQASH